MVTLVQIQYYTLLMYFCTNLRQTVRNYLNGHLEVEMILVCGKQYRRNTTENNCMHLPFSNHDAGDTIHFSDIAHVVVPPRNTKKICYTADVFLRANILNLHTGDKFHAGFIIIPEDKISFGTIAGIIIFLEICALESKGSDFLEFSLAMLLQALSNHLSG